MNPQINRMRLEQLNRLLTNIETDLSTAFMIIFSDYPTGDYVSQLLRGNINFVAKLNKTLAKNLIDLID